MYLCCDETTNPLRGPTRVLGVLKTGDKNLFIHRPSSPKPIEMEPRCVLDFYVAETAQRRGVGFLLFAFFLRNENKHPARLAYDRPSTKFLAFLRKHHGLVTYQNQTNNFVVFDAYFAVKPRPASAAKEAKKLSEGRGVGLAAAARAKAAAARAAREEASTRDAKRREDTTRLLAVSSSSTRASSEVFLSRSDDGSNSSELRDEERRGLARRAPPRGASDGPSRESGISLSFSSRYKRPGRRFAERRDAGMTNTDYPYGSRDADDAKGSRRFFSTNENEKNANADDELRDDERLSPKPPPAFVPKPPRRATPPDVESDDSAWTTNDVSSSHDPPPRFKSRDASSAGGSRSSKAYDPSSSMSRDSTMTSFPSSSNDASFTRKPPSLRGTSYASFVRGVREMGRATLRDGDEHASKTNAFPSLGETLHFATADGLNANDDLKAATSTRAQKNVTAQNARGEYGQFVPPREGYYRARSFVKLNRAPTYHFASDAAPFLPSTNGEMSQNARLHDRTIRFAERPIGRFPETRGGIPSVDLGHTGVHSYGAQQDLFLRRRVLFERAEATARGDKRFGDFRILSADDDDAISSETRIRHRGAAGSSASRRLARLAPLYGDGRYYGADALTRRARLAAAPSAEPELVRVGRRAMAENF